MTDLHTWITAKVTEAESVTRAQLIGRRAAFEPDCDGRAITGTVTAVSYGPDGLNLAIAQHGCEPVDDLPAPVRAAEAALRRCEADHRILARHNVNHTVFTSPLYATACHGCGTFGDCDDPVSENLNDCPELLDLAHAHGITQDELNGLDRPQPSGRKSEVQAWIVSAQLMQPLSFADPGPPTIVINGMDRQPLVTINPDGTLDYGPGYDPDEAARIFWDALRRYMGARCTNCGHAPGLCGEADHG